MKDIVRTLVKDAVAAHERLLEEEQVSVIAAIADRIVAAYRNGGKLVVFGNGGSAADAQHLAAELVCRFEKDRKALPALALTTDTSNLTAIGNDFGYENVFSRQVEALVGAGDVVIGISTSGNSPNVLKAMAAARERGAVTVGFTTEDGGRLKESVDICFRAPTPVTARAQECHILAVHILCSIVEGSLFGAL